MNFVVHRLAVFLVLAGLLSGCADSQGPARPDGKLDIVATSGMVADIAQQIAGERAVVFGMMGAGVDPHTYKPTRNDIVALANANVVFFSGLNLEGRMQENFQGLKASGKHVFAVTDVLPHEDLRQPADASGHYDPHVWMNVRMWRECAAYVARCLSEADPAGKATYEANAAKYLAELDALDAYAREMIASIPEEHRVLVTAHDAFEYFGGEYKIPVRAVQGLSPESQPSLKEVNELIDFIVSKQIKAIFVESSVNVRNVRAIIEGAHARGWNLTIGGELYSDAMGPAGTYDGTYVGMIDHNVTTIAHALGGNPPTGGFQEWYAARQESSSKESAGDNHARMTREGDEPREQAQGNNTSRQAANSQIQ